jgi:predicted dehydrogenase
MGADLIMTSDVGAWAAICAMGNALDDLGCHQLDLLRYLFDREITSMRARHVGEGEIHMTVGLDGAVTATCIAAHGPMSQERVTVRGDGWAYEVHHGSQRISPLGGAVRSILDVWDNASRRLRGGRSAMMQSYEVQLRSFVQHVREQAQPSPGITDGLEAVRAVAAARLSAAQNGQAVNLPSRQSRTNSHE